MLCVVLLCYAMLCHAALTLALRLCLLSWLVIFNNYNIFLCLCAFLGHLKFSWF